MAVNPYVNKVQLADGTTVIDISDTTAAASDVASGKYFYTAAGEKVQGTSSGGGSGGLEYETGTYTPASDIDRPTISFAKTHTVPPSFVMMSDVSDNSGITSNSIVYFGLVDSYRITGSGWPYSTTTAKRMAIANYAYMGTSSTSSSNHMITYNSDDSGSGSNAYYRYWATESNFMPSTNNANRKWRAGRTYKWIAVWGPTT